jgi:hypothetical protein
VEIGGFERARHREIPLAQIDGYPELAALLTVWRANAVGDMPPPRIDPLAVPRQLLPGAMLSDVEGELGNPAAARLRIRLAGTMLCDFYGGELRGRTLHDVLMPEDARAMTLAAVTAIVEGRPMLMHRPDIRFPAVEVDYVALLLPLSADGRLTRLLEMPDPATVRRRPRSNAA